jgi:hypothetical protein
MNRHVWLLLSGCFWAVMMFLLFEREIRPYFEYQQSPTYKTLLREMKDAVLERRSISFGQERIGEAETLFEPQVSGGHRMTTRLSMRMAPMMPMKDDDRTFMGSTLTVDDRYQLASFEINAWLRGIRVTASGERQDEKLRVSYNFLLMRGEQVMDFPRDATLADSFLPYQGGGALGVGKKWKMRILDLDNLISVKGQQLSFTEMYAAVVAREPVPEREGAPEAFKVEVRENPNDEIEKYSFWVDDQGVVIKQVTMSKTAKGKLPWTLILEERRSMPLPEARNYDWRIRLPR